MSFWQTYLQYICFLHLPFWNSKLESFRGVTDQSQLQFQVNCQGQLSIAHKTWILLSLAMHNNHVEVLCTEIQFYTSLIILEQQFALLSQVRMRWRSKLNFLVLSMQHKATWCSLQSLGWKLMFELYFWIPHRPQPKKFHYHCFI